MQKFQDDIQPNINLNSNSDQQIKSSLYGNVRNNFIKKVYSILSVQLLITVMFVSVNMLSQSFAKFQAEQIWMFYVSLVLSLVSIIALVCVPGLAMSYPKNMAFLLIFTLAESYMVSFICSLYTPDSVLNAAIATLAATLGLSFYAYKIKSDFTQCMHFMMAFFWSFFFVTFTLSIVNIFFIRSDFITILIAIAIASVYSIYLIIDTQLILGGRKAELTMDNYVLGAAMLYIDIIQIFLQLLKIVGKRK